MEGLNMYQHTESSEKSCKQENKANVSQIYVVEQYLSITYSDLVDCLPNTSLLFLAIERRVYSEHQCNRQMLAVSATLVARGSCVTRFWPIRNKQQTSGDFWEEYLYCKEDRFAHHSCLQLGLKQPSCNHEETSIRVKVYKLVVTKWSRRCKVQHIEYNR